MSLGYCLYDLNLISVGLERASAISEVHAPDLDVLVLPARDEESVVARHAELEDGEGVAVQLQVEVMGIAMEYLYRIR